MNLPVINCDGCGACCHGFQVPPFHCTDPLGGDFDFDTDEDFIRLPENLKVELVVLYSALGNDAPIRSHCPWFNPATKQCIHYEHRPVICREFEVGGDVCLDIRQESGVGA